jgi:hypothetical protein
LNFDDLMLIQLLSGSQILNVLLMLKKIFLNLLKTFIYSFLTLLVLVLNI